MKIEKILYDKKKINILLEKYVTKKVLIEKKDSKSLVSSHLKKSSHNLLFVDFLFNEKKFYDWMIVGLYYAIYHASLALVCKKGFISKNHTATLLFLTKHYASISEKDILFLEQMYLSKEDISFYASLMEKRQDASYSTSLLFDEQSVIDLRIKSIDFINKVKAICED